MAGPRFVGYFVPVLRALDALGGSGRPGEVADAIVKRAERGATTSGQLTPTGIDRFKNQVAWARFYLSKAGLVDASERGVWRLSDAGRARLDMTDIEAVALFREIHARYQNKADAEPEDDDADDVSPPDVADPRAALGYKEQLLARLQGIPAPAFERFCQRLLREAGFQSVEVTGRAGDGGIDGIGVLEVISLVSFKVLFQCKRYAGTVSPSQVRDFRGAMAGRADKGVILTTGSFTADARKESVRDGVPPIELVDGEKLIEMCQRFGLGLREVRTFAVDEDFFHQFE